MSHIELILCCDSS